MTREEISAMMGEVKNCDGITLRETSDEAFHVVCCAGDARSRFSMLWVERFGDLHGSACERAASGSNGPY